MSTTIAITEAQARWFRLRRSGLLTPFAGPEAAARTLAGVQAQILPAAGLALWNRTAATSQQDLDRLLHHERTLLKLWGQRGTLHLYPASDWPLLHAAQAGRGSWWSRQAARSGEAGAYAATVERAAALLQAHGTIGRTELRAAGFDEELLSSWGGVFADLVRAGLACHAGQVGGEGRFAAREHWLPTLEWNPPTPEAANAELARRYLAAYGPATAHDLAYWRGVGLGHTQQTLATMQHDLAEVALDGQRLLVLRADLADLAAQPPAADGWPVRMLGRFDPLLLGLKAKGWIVPPAFYGRVWRPAGHIEATLLSGGQAVATWRYDRVAAGLVLTLKPFAPLPNHTLAAAERLAPHLAAFFGLPLADLHFTPASD